MIYNKISGSTVNSHTATLFKQFDEEQCFLAFAKSEETWGMSALVGISLPPTVASSDVFGKFIDRRSGAKYTGEDATTIRIYKTNATVEDFVDDPSKYFALADEDIIDVSVYLEYMNSSWCVLKNLPSNYRDFITNINNEKYYLVKQPDNAYTMNPHPAPDFIKNIVKINIKSTADYTTINEPVTLCVGEDGVDDVYLANLTKSVTMLGETSYSGLTEAMFNPTSEEDDVEYANESMDVNRTYFYFVNSRNIKLGGNIYLVPRTNPDASRSIFHYEGTGDDRKFLLFKTSSVGGMVGTLTDYYIKVSFSSPPTELAIYHETLPFIYPKVNAINTISDANPPGLDLNYLNDSTVHTSLVDIKGYVKLKKGVVDNGVESIFTKISYVKEIVSTVEKARFEAMGFEIGGAKRRLESINMTSATAVSRFGNVRPKPNGLAYKTSDRSLYLWSTNFVVGDVVKITSDVNSENPVIMIRTISGVDYEEGFVVFGSVGGNTSVELGLVAVPTSNDDILDANSQVVLVKPTKILNVIDFAVCTDMKDALALGMESVMIDVLLPATGNNLYEGIYRQIAVCCRPSYYDITSNTLKNCADSPAISFVDSNVTSLFYDGDQSSNHSWETGTILYIANKNPVYRKYINSRESFKLII